jgi:hypothetical protein
VMHLVDILNQNEALLEQHTIADLPGVYVFLRIAAGLKKYRNALVRIDGREAEPIAMAASRIPNIARQNHR